MAGGLAGSLARVKRTPVKPAGSRNGRPEKLVASTARRRRARRAPLLDARSTDWDRRVATRSTDWDRRGSPDRRIGIASVDPIDGLGSPRGSPDRRIGIARRSETPDRSTERALWDRLAIPNAGSVRRAPSSTPDRRIGIAKSNRSVDWDRQTNRRGGSVNRCRRWDRVAIRKAGSVRRGQVRRGQVRRGQVRRGWVRRGWVWRGGAMGARRVGAGYRPDRAGPALAARVPRGEGGAPTGG